MSKILDEIADILDLEEVNPEQVLADLETWDSLAKISAISLAHEQYKKTITLADLNGIKTVSALVKVLTE